MFLLQGVAFVFLQRYPQSIFEVRSSKSSQNAYVRSITSFLTDSDCKPLNHHSNPPETKHPVSDASHCLQPVSSYTESPGGGKIPPGIDFIVTLPSVMRYEPADDATVAKVAREQAVFMREDQYCIDLMHDGKLAEAKKRLELKLKSGHYGLAPETLLEVVIRSEGWSEAYRLGRGIIAAATPQSNFNSPMVCLKTALAGAMCGEVAPGEKEYCLNFLLRGGDRRLAARLPLTSTPETVSFLASLAIGGYYMGFGDYPDAKPYVLLAKHILPNNSIGCQSYAEICYQYGEFSKAVAAMDEALHSETDPVEIRGLETIRKLYQTAFLQHGDQAVPAFTGRIPRFAFDDDDQTTGPKQAKP